MTRKKAPPVVAPAMDREERLAYFRTLKGRMDAKDQRVVDAMAKVLSVYVECPRDRTLRIGFRRFLQRYMAAREVAAQTGEEPEADVYFVVGASGAGKTRAVGKLLREEPVLRTLETPYGPVTPYVSIKLKGYGLPRLVAARIIRAAGYGQVNSAIQGEAWDGLNDALQHQGVFLVHIDEAQHLLKKNASDNERRELANAIKGASIDPEWPIAFVFSGLPEVLDLPASDGQVSRRGDFTAFTDVVMDEERYLVDNIVRELSKSVDLDASDLLDGDLSLRLARAADNKYARMCQLTVTAIQEALNKGRPTLEMSDFVKAYERRTMTYGRLDLNHFHAENWRDLPAGSFLEFPDGRDADD